MPVPEILHQLPGSFIKHRLIEAPIIIFSFPQGEIRPHRRFQRMIRFKIICDGTPCCIGAVVKLRSKYSFCQIFRLFFAIEILSGFEHILLDCRIRDLCRSNQQRCKNQNGKSKGCAIFDNCTYHTVFLNLTTNAPHTHISECAAHVIFYRLPISVHRIWVSLFFGFAN